MNLAASTSSIASTSNTSDASSTKSSAKTSAKTSDTSFDEEMKSALKSEDEKSSDVETSKKTEKNSKTEIKKSEKSKPKIEIQDNLYENIDDTLDLHGEVNFTDYKYGNRSQAILSQNIQNLIDTKDLISSVHSASTIDYDAINMSYDDANFFANLVEKTDMSFESISKNINNELIENRENIQQNIKVSSVLMEKLSESLKTNKPFRIDFDKDVSVIIKVNKDGSLSANFIPGDKAVEQYLRENISSLKQRFDEENLPYSQLSYSNHNNKEQQRRKKENDNE